MGFVYPRVKARRYAEAGPETYRHRDFIRRPDAGMTEEEPAAVMHGLTRLPEGIGAAPDRWFTGTGIPDFNGMAYTFHLEYESREIVGGTGAAFLDRMIRRHIVTGEVVELYNPVPKPGFPPAHSFVPGPTLDD